MILFIMKTYRKSNIFGNIDYLGAIDRMADAVKPRKYSPISNINYGAMLDMPKERVYKKFMHFGPAETATLSKNQSQHLIHELKERGYSSKSAKEAAHEGKELSRKYMNSPWGKVPAEYRKKYANIDFDGDGVPNKLDCFPFDYDRQAFFSSKNRRSYFKVPAANKSVSTHTKTTTTTSSGRSSSGSKTSQSLINAAKPGTVHAANSYFRTGSSGSSSSGSKTSSCSSSSGSSGGVSQSSVKYFLVPNKSQTTQQKIAEALGISPSQVNPNVNTINQSSSGISKTLSSSGGGSSGSSSSGSKINQSLINSYFGIGSSGSSSSSNTGSSGSSSGSSNQTSTQSAGRGAGEYYNPTTGQGMSSLTDPGADYIMTSTIDSSGKIDSSYSNMIAETLSQGYDPSKTAVDVVTGYKTKNKYEDQINLADYERIYNDILSGKINDPAEVKRLMEKIAPYQKQYDFNLRAGRSVARLRDLKRSIVGDTSTADFLNQKLYKKRDEFLQQRVNQKLEKIDTKIQDITKSHSAELESQADKERQARSSEYTQRVKIGEYDSPIKATVSLTTAADKKLVILKA